jgi:hypothetical protein
LVCGNKLPRKLYATAFIVFDFFGILGLLGLAGAIIKNGVMLTLGVATVLYSIFFRIEVKI